MAWPRFQLSVPAEATDPLSGQSVRGRTRDISRGGCYVISTDLLTEGTVVQFRIERDGIGFETLACVVRAVPGEGIGFAFLDTKAPQMELLERWLSELAEGD
jgi:c-di-GMP-binding flagellar brake protein YcgR